MYRISLNRCRPRIVAAATIRGTHTLMQIFSDDVHRTSARAVCDVKLVSTADSRTERLRLLRLWLYFSSLVPRPHPLTRRNGLVNQVEFLGLAHAFATM